LFTSNFSLGETKFLAKRLIKLAVFAASFQSFRILSYDESTAFSKVSSLHSAI
jgi:hypothetical protein